MLIIVDIMEFANFGIYIFVYELGFKIVVLFVRTRVMMIYDLFS